MSLSFLMPTNAMRVPGISCIGARIYLWKVSSFHVMPEDLSLLFSLRECVVIHDGERLVLSIISTYLNGGLTAGPALLPDNPGIFAESRSRTASLRSWFEFAPEPMVSSRCFTTGPLLLPGWPGTPAPRGTVTCPDD